MMNAKNGALTFAFTIAGGCLGYATNYHHLMGFVIWVVAIIGGFAASYKEE
jgi:hypothetical protein